MPEHFKKCIIIDDMMVSYRITYQGYYQVRYRRDGYDLEVAAKDLATAKNRFLKKLAEASRKVSLQGYPLFKDYAAEW